VKITRTVGQIFKLVKILSYKSTPQKPLLGQAPFAHGTVDLRARQASFETPPAVAPQDEVGGFHSDLTLRSEHSERLEG
jgi:hypothetical protein